MRLRVPTLWLAALWISGCVAKPEPRFGPVPAGANGTATIEAGSPTDNAQSGEPLIVTPDLTLMGRVSVYNEAGRFVVLDFPIGRLPANEQLLFVFRQGLKVGEVKVTGPQRDHITVGDLISGEARKGDEVRDR